VRRELEDSCSRCASASTECSRNRPAGVSLPAERDRVRETFSASPAALRALADFRDRGRYATLGARIRAPRRRPDRRPIRSHPAPTARGRAPGAGEVGRQPANARARASSSTRCALGAIAVARRPHGQALELLVDLEELLDLGAEGLGDVVQVVDSGPEWVAQRNAHELVAASLLVDHAEDAYRPNANPAAGERRVADEDEGVERVAVLAERPLDEPVVGGVDRRGEKAPIEDDRPELCVVLVLVASPRAISTGTTISPSRSGIFAMPDSLKVLRSGPTEARFPERPPFRCAEVSLRRRLRIETDSS
jgi:hypothetical protein